MLDYIDREISLEERNSELKNDEVHLMENLITDMLPGLEPGSYYLIVRTNITLSIRENINDSLKMANNICPSAGSFDITLPEIEIGTRKVDTLAREGVKYYQITVPDTSNVSLRINLNWGALPDKKGTIGTFNEMYLKYGSLPTLSNYDQSFDNPYSAKQEIIVPSTQPGIYYLMVKNNYQDADIQDITIDASLLGFELLYIDQQKGGNGGELTIKMTGTGLNYGVKPRLIKSNSGINKTIPAKETYYTDATELYATFDLRGADQGSYDAVLVQDMSRYEFTYQPMEIEGETVQVPDSMYLVPDSLVTTLPGIFAVETSNNRGYLEYKNIPENVRGGRGFESSMEITNISNNDMIAPLYMLKAGWDQNNRPILTKLPGEDDYTAGYKKFLILAEEGPAGIIRSGGKGSIRIYSTAPPANEKIRFDMMKIQDSGFEFDFNAELFWTGADKNDPNWTETIYAIEQEVGNSWEGYNKVLVEQILEFDTNALNMKYLSNDILLDKISFTKLKQKAEASKGKSHTQQTSLPTKEEILKSVLNNYCPNCNKVKLDCTFLTTAKHKALLWECILGFYAAGFDNAGDFLRHYIGDDIFFDDTVGPGFPDWLDVATAFSTNYHPRSKKLDDTAEKDELMFRDIHNNTVKYLGEWIRYKLRNDKNYFDNPANANLYLDQLYNSSDFEKNPLVNMKNLNNIYKQYNEFPHPSFYFITKLSGQQGYITLLDIIQNRFEFRLEGMLFWAFGAMKATDHVNAKIDTKVILEIETPSCPPKTSTLVEYTVNLEYCFKDYYTFDTQDENKSDYDKAASILRQCGEATPFDTYLKIEFEFTGMVLVQE